MSKLHPKAPVFRGQPTILVICQRQAGTQAPCSVQAGLQARSAAPDASNYCPVSRGNSTQQKTTSLTPTRRSSS